MCVMMLADKEKVFVCDIITIILHFYYCYSYHYHQHTFLCTFVSFFCANFPTLLLLLIHFFHFLEFWLSMNCRCCCYFCFLAAMWTCLVSYCVCVFFLLPKLFFASHSLLWFFPHFSQFPVQFLCCGNICYDKHTTLFDAVLFYLK